MVMSIHLMWGLRRTGDACTIKTIERAATIGRFARAVLDGAYPGGRGAPFALTRAQPHKETSMSQSGQPHPKADNGGQRPASDPKKAGHSSGAAPGSAKEAVGSGKAASAGASRDVKK